MDKMIDLINQGGTGEYDARQERGEAVAWAHVATMNGVDFVQYPLYLTEQDAKWSIGNYAEGSKVRIEPLTFLHPTPDAGRVAELEAEQCRPAWHPDDAAARIADLEAQLAESREREASSILEACVRDKMGEILNEVANILKGARDDGEGHQWHDLPEAAADVVAEREIYRKGAENMSARIAAIESRPVESMKREAFEAWVVKCRFFKKLNAHLKQNADGSYGCFAVNDRWIAWQAALAADKEGE